jgi:polyhydroxybutyrate depolymerase
VAVDVERLAWAGCSDRGAVELYRIVGGGHTWPGATALRSERLGATTSSIDATKLVLDFFDAHPARADRARVATAWRRRR